jgi:hypothetical protein
MSAVQIVKASEALSAYMAAASAEWDKRSSIADREKAMQALSDSVAADIAKQNAEAAQYRTATNRAAALVKERVAAVDAREIEIQARMDALAAREAEQCAAQAAADQMAVARTKALDSQAQALSAKQDVLAKREAALDERELALRKASETMRALVA